MTGDQFASPVKTFAQMHLGTPLLNAIAKHGYSDPTPIQKQAIPIALNGRDIIGIAKTGSGKTAAFILPMLVHIHDQPPLRKGDGPIGVVVAPTRELAHQIYVEAKRFAKKFAVRVCPVYGGVSKNDQVKELKAGCEVVVCTPGRLIDVIKMKKITNMKRVTFLVLDEADRMFDMGFEPQVRSIAAQIRPDRQSLFFLVIFLLMLLRVLFTYCEVFHTYDYYYALIIILMIIIIIPLIFMIIMHLLLCTYYHLLNILFYYFIINIIMILIEFNILT